MASNEISVSDGLLDVILVRDASVGSFMAVDAEIVGRGSQSEGFQLWQGREIKIECDPPQTVQGDGDILENTPLTAKVLPGVLPVLVPSS